MQGNGKFLVLAVGLNSQAGLMMQQIGVAKEEELTVVQMLVKVDARKKTLDKIKS